MRESAAVVDAWLRFCAGVSNKRVDEVYDIVSAEADLVIGTAPGENVTDRSAMRFGFEPRGSRSGAGWHMATKKDPWAGSSISPGSGFPMGRAWTAE
jgi:hypothetical protein